MKIPGTQIKGVFNAEMFWTVLMKLVGENNNCNIVPIIEPKKETAKGA